MIFKWVLLGLMAVFAIGTVTMFLWNWLIPTLFNGPEITFFQALGLLLLSKLLSWGFGKHWQHSGHGNAPYWKNRLYEKFSNMSPEQREVFKQKMKDKWCRWEGESSKKEESDHSNG